MIDLHIHTNYSGGESNVIEILKIAEKRNISTIAITDNNTCDAYKELKRVPVTEYFSGKIIPGCEFSTIVNNAYILGIFEPLKEFDGKCIAAIHRLNDDDDKLIIVPEGKVYSKEQIDALVEFQERFFEYEIIEEMQNIKDKGEER